MTAPKPPRVLEVEDGYYVAGTHDVDLAVDLLVEAEKIYTPYLDHLTNAFTGAGGIPFRDALPPAEREDWRQRARIGYAHTGPVPGNPDDSDYTWMIYTHDAPAPGRYKLVWWW